MSKKLSINRGQAKKLVITGAAGGIKYHLDFRRFFYLGVPSSAEMEASTTTFKKRDKNIAQSLFEAFSENTDCADATKKSRFTTLVTHVIDCDTRGIDPLSEKAIERVIDYLTERHRQGLLKDSSCGHKLKDIKAVFLALDLPTHHWFPTQSIFGRTQSEPTEAYSDTEIKKLLRFLYTMFIQFYEQFTANPQHYIEAPKSHKGIQYSMTFRWNQEAITVLSPLSKLVCVSYYLLSYYTWGNSSVLSKVKRPNLDGISLKETWARMSEHKPRANRIVTLGIGENDSINVPHHACALIDKIIHISQLIDPSPDALLIVNASGGTPTPVNGNLTSYFNSWAVKKFGLLDDLNRPLRPEPKRFRASGINRFQIHTGDVLKTAVIAGNTPQVIKKHYSSGNRHENNLQLQSSVTTMENSARQQKGVGVAKDTTKEQMRLTILPYEEYLNSASPPSRNVNGSFCGDPFGDLARQEAKKALQRGLLRDGESLLACANLLMCFECSHQVLVDDVAETWCILSFRECIEESAYLHLDKSHYESNFRAVLTNIDTRLALLSRQTIKAAEQELIQKGRHPFWAADDNVIISLSITSGGENV